MGVKRLMVPGIHGVLHIALVPSLILFCSQIYKSGCPLNCRGCQHKEYSFVLGARICFQNKSDEMRMNMNTAEEYTTGEVTESVFESQSLGDLVRDSGT